MSFYYFSILSFLLATIISMILIAVLRVTWTRKNLPKGWLYVLIPIAIVAPWGEEWWIAYNFGQLCRKDAGLHIYKTVETEGFYNDTGTTRLPPDSPYQFIEAPDDKGKFHRVDRASSREKDSALNWHAEEFRGKQLEKGKNEWIKHPVDDQMQVIVEIDSGYAWRLTKLDKPAARYHYTRDRYGVSVAHKVSRQEERVIDTTSGELLGRYVVYSRKPHSYYLSFLGPYGCDGPDGGPNTKQIPLIYRQVLKPKS